MQSVANECNVCSVNEFWRCMETVTVPAIIQASHSERIRLLGAANLRQIRSRQSNDFHLLYIIIWTLCPFDVSAPGRTQMHPRSLRTANIV